MTVFWSIIGYFNQQSMKQYNSILERYLTLNNVSTSSGQALVYLSKYLNEDASHFPKYQWQKQSLLHTKSGLEGLQNNNNQVVLTNYIHMIDSQIEAMDLAIMSHQLGKKDESSFHYDEATKISQYIGETTLVLFKKEITFQEQFYVSVMELSKNLQRLGVWTLTVIFVILILFSYWFSKGITKSIHQLTQAAKEIANGNFEQVVTIESNDEISFLAKTFNQMRENIRELIQEIKQKAQIEKELQQSQLLLKESELNRLQNQINPHFLYNTLNVLSKKAYLDGSLETSDLISTVANLLRYNLSKRNTPVTLEDEIVIINEYLTILKARFTKRVSFSIQIEERYRTIIMPHFILQPIVENAFSHGIEPFEQGGKISIHAFEQEGKVHIQISDDGAGMEEEVQSLLLRGQDVTAIKSESTGIGLQNVIKRLQLFYGMEDVFDCTSQKGHGTTVTLKLPLAN
jgi:sensor histidine kinase YesM